MYGYCKALLCMAAIVGALAISPSVFADSRYAPQQGQERYVSYPYRPYYDTRRPRYYRPYRYYRHDYYPRYRYYPRDRYRYYDGYPYYNNYGPRGGFQIQFRS